METRKEMKKEEPKSERIALEDVKSAFGNSQKWVDLGVRKLGGWWFKDTQTQEAIGVVRGKGGLEIAEVRAMKATVEHKAKVATIKCVECGEEREVATQDAFQVKRCLDCQKKFRNKKRAERAKVRRAEKRTTRDLEKLNGTTEDTK